jgi:hypothetical protein
MFPKSIKIGGYLYDVILENRQIEHGQSNLGTHDSVVYQFGVNNLV